MKRQIFIQPRRSGKTTKAIEYLKENKNSILIAPNQILKRDIEKRYGVRNFSRIFTLDEAIDKVGEGFYKIHPLDVPKRIIIDEPFLMNKKALYNFYCSIKHMEIDIYCYTTADRLYDRSLIELTKAIKQYPSIVEYIDYSVRAEIAKYYWDSLLTEDFEVSTTIVPNRHLSKEQYMTDILGEFLK